MKTKRSFLVLASAAVLFGGCVVQSIHPLFSESDYIPYADFVGTWVQKEDDKEQGFWTFAAEGARYQLTHTDDKNHKAAFSIAAGKIGTNIFAEISPRDPLPGSELNDLMTVDLIPAHLFAKVLKTNDALLLRAMDIEWLVKHLSTNPTAIAHVMRDKVPILTASTEELKKFVAKHADDPLVFKNEIKLVRKHK